MIKRSSKRRILVVDDDASVQTSFRRILVPAAVKNDTLDSLETSLFAGLSSLPPGASKAPPRPEGEYDMVSATQGMEGLQEVERSKQLGQLFSMAFVDMRMPPGWDGVETCARIWMVDRDLPIVICSAFYDYSWKDVIDRLKRPDLRLLPKPFATKDVFKILHEVCRKDR